MNATASTQPQPSDVRADVHLRLQLMPALSMQQMIALSAQAERRGMTLDDYLVSQISSLAVNGGTLQPAA